MTRYTNAKITQSTAGEQNYISLWSNTQRLFSALDDSIFEQDQPNIKKPLVWKPEQKQLRGSFVTFTSANWKLSAASFCFIRVEKWHSDTGR